MIGKNGLVFFTQCCKLLGRVLNIFLSQFFHQNRLNHDQIIGKAGRFDTGVMLHIFARQQKENQHTHRVVIGLTRVGHGGVQTGKKSDGNGNANRHVHIDLASLDSRKSRLKKRQA